MTYNADSIEVLEDLEHLRLRPGMYIGSQDSDGVKQIAKEIFDNSVDEYLAGHATQIRFNIDTENHVFRIADNGRGIPIEKHSKTGESTLITVFTNLQAGGKFSNKTYAVSAGLHGVGLKATNALSDTLMARVWRKGRCYEQHFAKGEPQSKKPKVNRSLDKKGRHGTEVVFHPDPEIFGDHRINVDQVLTWLEETSHLCPGLKIVLNVDGEITKFHSKGLGQLVRTRASGVLMHEPLEVSSTDNTTIASFVWTEGEGEDWFSACNASATIEGGKHVDGAMKAIYDVLKPFAKRKKVEAKDLVDGLVAGIHVLVADPQFKSQTKQKLLNAEMRQVVYDVVYPQLKAFFDANKKLAEKVVTRASQLRQARESYKKLRTAINKTTVKKDTKGVLPGKLVEAMRCKPYERELFIVEGDSAGGSAKAARDKYYQEVLPLRGKIPNSILTKPGKLLSNNEISSVLTAIGVRLDPKTKNVDLDHVRVGKILLLMDADPDGMHIASLLLTFLCTWLPDYVKLGNVYIIDSPLFVGVYKEKRWYGHSLKELEKQSGLPAGKLQASRLKGHGSASAKSLGRYAMNPETRKLWHVTLADNDQEVILSLMGANSATRKTLLGIS